MTKLLKYSLASLIVCLCLSAMAFPRGQTKKFFIRGHVEAQITALLPGGSFTTHEIDIGVSTYAGRHVNTYDAVYTPDGKGGFNIIIPAGESVVANHKGTILWSGDSTKTPAITFTGGTGLYVGVQGGFSSTVYNMVMTPPTISYDYIGEGEITFPTAMVQILQLKVHQGLNTLTVDMQKTTDPAKPYFNMLDVGEATHFGSYVNEGWVQTDMSAQPPRSLGGEGTLTAANGDSVGWVLALDPANPERVYILPNTGTGRFAGATGFLDNFPISMTPNPYGLTIVHWAEGELSIPSKTK